MAKTKPQTMNVVEVPISKIIRNRDQRQRRELLEIEDLAHSIQHRGLLQPIIINEAFELIAGERRLEAHVALKRKTIFARQLSDLTHVERELIELEENTKRQDLPWPDRVAAVLRITRLLESTNPDITMDAIAERIGLSPSASNLNRMVRVAQAIEDGEVGLLEASSYRTAYQKLMDKLGRQVDGELEGILRPAPRPQSLSKEGDSSKPAGELTLDDLDLTGGEAEPVRPETFAELKPGCHNASFLDWAPSFQGQRFNFIHCDFPYGLDHGDSEQGKSGFHGTYHDSEETYWNLLECFCKHRDNFMAASCHILFWFSMKHYRGTLDYFQQEMPEVEWLSHPLIWHKTDNKGMMPDSRREGRRVYETALFGRRADRKIISPVSNCYGAPTGKKAHLSMKPEPMLRHFFRMAVDTNTRMLDPTAGSGTALRAADSLSAEFVYGLELDPEYAAEAMKAYNVAKGLRQISEAS